MKQFNRIITVEVSVDAIAQNLLDTIAPDFKHREMLVESIIGSNIDTGKLGYIYNALNGFTNEINFAKGDKIYCSNKTYMFKTPSSIEKDNSEYAEMGDAVVIDTDVYAEKKVLIEYDHYGRKGEVTRKQAWVNHTDCVRTVPTIDLRKGNGIVHEDIFNA